MMTDQQIRDLIRSEIAAQSSANRFTLATNTRHTHNGLDSPRINAANLVPGLKTLGTITMSTAGAIYTFQTGFQPSSVVFTGTPHTNDFSVHTFVYGYAALGQNLPFQPAGNRTVVAGGKYEIIQGSTCFYAAGSGQTTSFAATNDENHIVNVSSDGSNTLVRADVISYSPSEIKVQLTTLAANWTLIGNWYVS